MIEISHAQARWLIRLELDRTVPEEQWNALQAHLERCPECQSYRRHVIGLEKGLRHGLRARWSTEKEAQRPMSEAVLAARRQRDAFWRLARYAGLTLLAALLLGGWIVFARANQPLSGSTPGAAQVVSVVPATPTASGPAFHGLMAFSAKPEGVEHIYVLAVNPSGPEMADLTPGAGRAVAPTWSPDGQWLAFLSDRDRPEPRRGMDIYLINLAGTRLTRLTADPSIDWSGPLSWSPDGSTIAAVGTRYRDGADSTERWIYLVSWDGAPPRIVPETQGAQLPRFAPKGRRIAYQAPGDNGASELRIYEDLNEVTVRVAGGSPDHLLYLGENARFAWSPDASALVFVDQNTLPEPYVPAGVAEVRVTSGLDAALQSPRSEKTGVSSIRVTAYSTPHAGLAAAWTPSGWLLLLDPIEDPGGRPGSAALTIFEGMENASTLVSNMRQHVLPELFVYGSLSGTNEQANWLVLAARTTEAASPGIYALHLADRLERWRAVQLTRLLDLPAGAEDLQVRPVPKVVSGEGPTQTIDPVAARLPSMAGIPAEAPADLLSRVWASKPDKAGLIQLRPDGSGWVQVNRHPGYCPRVSPDGRQVAYVVEGPGDVGRSDIYVMDTDGQNLRRLTYTQDFPTPTTYKTLKAHYDCPTWSPDGTRLATWFDTDESEYLAVLQVSASTAEASLPTLTRYFSLMSTGLRAAPQWSPDSTHVILSVQTQNYYAPEIVTQNVRSSTVSRLQLSDGWHSVGSITLSNDPGWLAYTALYFADGFGIKTDLQILGLREGPIVHTMDLAAALPWAANMPTGPLVWRGSSLQMLQPRALPLAVASSSSQPVSRAHSSSGAGFIGFYLPGGPHPQDRASLIVYDLTTQHVSTLLSLKEELRSVAWSPDGNWVVYATGSGVWIINVPDALTGQAAPAWLGSEQVEELDWH